MRPLFVPALFLVVAASASNVRLVVPPPQRKQIKGIVNQRRLGDNWGANIHWTKETQPGEAAYLSKAFKMARMDFQWGSIERFPHGCGKYDFSAYDILLETMKNHSIRPYWIMDYGNQCYPQANTTSTNSGCHGAPCVAAYGNFAKAAVAHFKGNNIIWENTNEPNGMGDDDPEQLAKLDQAAGPHFHAAGEFFVGPATAAIDPDYITQAAQDGLFNSPLAGLSVHPYRPAFFVPETVIADFFQLREILANFNQSDLPILSGEWGYSSGGPLWCPSLNSVVEQGKFLPRMWLSALQAGTSLCIYYDWHDDGNDPHKCQQNFGSVYNLPTHNKSEPFQPKPAYMAALTLQETVGNAVKFAGNVSYHFGSSEQQSPTTQPIFALSFLMDVNHAGISKKNPGSNYSYAVWTSLANTTFRNVTIDVLVNPTARSDDDRSRETCWTATGAFGDDQGVVCTTSTTTEATEGGPRRVRLTNVTDAPLYLTPL